MPYFRKSMKRKQFKNIYLVELSLLKSKERILQPSREKIILYKEIIYNWLRLLFYTKCQGTVRQYLLNFGKVIHELFFQGAVNSYIKAAEIHWI